MRTNHAADATERGRIIGIAYDSRTRVRMPSDAAPMFDATSAPRKTTYRPPVSAQHYVDAEIAARMRAEKRAVKAANRVQTRIRANALSSGVRLVRPDGQTAGWSFKPEHGAIIRGGTGATSRRPLSKSVKMSRNAQDRIRAGEGLAPTVGTFYPAPVGPKPIGEDLNVDAKVVSRMVQTPARPTAPTLAERLAKFRGAI